MKKSVFTYVVTALAKLAIFFASTLLLAWAAYAIVWPTTPSGEPVYGGLIPFLQKALTDTGFLTTDGKVKKTLDSDGVGSGLLVASSGNIGIGNASPTAKLDINGSMKVSSLQLTSGSSSGYVLSSDSSGNASWIPNNYRLKVSDLMTGGTYGHMCFLMDDKTVRCSGYNGNGELGIGHDSNRYFPVEVPLTGTVKKLVSINLSMYALMDNGTIYSWGYNSYGELGVGDTTARYSPTLVSGITNATDIIAGGAYYTDGSSVSWWFASACALLADKTVKCWGYGGYGQLGEGTSSSQYTPTTVVGLSNVKKVVMEENNYPSSACALLYDGSIRCWGWNGYGQLGNGDTNNRPNISTVKGITNAIDLEMGGSYWYGAHACAILADKTVKCWGYGSHGQLGDGTSAWNSSPVVATGLSNVAKIVITRGSGYSNYAILTDGTVKSWGYNGHGQLGVWDTNNRTTPTLIPGLSNVVAISSTGWGPVHACALISDGTIKCWGYNGYGQVGVGDTSNRYTPTQVMWITDAVRVETYDTFYSNRAFSCAILKDGSSKCWGYNGYGQFGQFNTNSYTIPVPVRSLNKD